MGGTSIGRVDIDAQLKLVASSAAKLKKDVQVALGKGVEVPVTARAADARLLAELRTGFTGVSAAAKEAGTETAKTATVFSGAGNALRSFTGLVDKADGKLRQFGLTSKDLAVILGAGLAGGVAFAIRSIINLGVASVKAAADLGEAQNLISVTFGTDLSQKIEAFARGAATSIGLSETAALKAVGSFGALAKNLGFTAEVAADFGISFTKVAADIASLQNIEDINQVITALQSALRGTSFEPIAALNISLNQTALEAAAAREGIAEFGAELTFAQKAAALEAEVLRQTANAAGDFGRTADQLPNQLRQFTAQVENLQAALGKFLVPAISETVQALNDLLGPLIDIARVIDDILIDIGGAIEDFAEDAAAPIRDFFEGFGIQVNAFADKSDEALEKLVNLGGPIGELAQAELDAREATDSLSNAQGVLSSTAGQAALAVLSEADKLRILEESAKATAKAFDELNAAKQSTFEGVISDFSRVLDEQKGSIDKTADALERYNRALEDSELRIADAERAFARTFRDTADDIADAQNRITEAQEDSVRRIADAQEKILDVQRDILRGQEDLQNRAQDAIERIADAEQELARTRRDAARSVEEAEERLNRLLLRRRETVRQVRLREIEEAREDLADAREQAAERVADAEERIVDARRQQAEVERDIIEFREDSVRRLADAQQNLVDVQRKAAEDIAEAEEKLVETEERAAEKIEDAQRRIEDAHRDSARAITDALEAIEKAASSAGGKAALTLEKLAEGFKLKAENVDSFTNGLLQIQEKLSGFAIFVDDVADKEIKQAFLARLFELAKESPEIIGQVADLTVDELKQRFTGPFAEEFKAAKKLADANLDKYPENLRLKIKAAAEAGVEGLAPLLEAFDDLPKKTGPAADAIREQMEGVAKTLFETGKDAPGFLDPVRLALIQKILDPSSKNNEVIRATRELLQNLNTVRSEPLVEIKGTEEALNKIAKVQEAIAKLVGPISSSGGAGEGVTIQVQGLQHGGPARRGDFAVVGERGPELVRFGDSGRVVSNEQILEALKGTREAGVVQHFTINAPVADADFLANAIAARLGRRIRR